MSEKNLRRWVAVLAVYAVIATAAFLAVLATRPRAATVGAVSTASAPPAALETVHLGAGLYVIGEDVPAGVYRISVEPGTVAAVYYLYRSRDAYDADLYQTYNMVKDYEGDVAVVEREELPTGGLIRVTDKVVLEPYGGKGA